MQLSSPKFTPTMYTRESSLGQLIISESFHTNEKCYLKEFRNNNIYLNNNRPNISKEERITLSSPYILKLFSLCFENFDKLVFHSCNIEFFERTLLDEIMEKRQQSSLFLEIEVLKLIENVVEALLSMRKIGLFHGGLYPEAIFKCGTCYKIADQSLLLSDFHWFFNKCLQFRNQGIYDLDVFLSPIQIKALNERSLDYLKSDNEKNDVFTLGVTLLLVITLESPLFFYDSNTHSHSFHKIQSSLSNASKIYSGELLAFISQMLHFDEKARPSFAQLQELIEKITKKSQFFPSSPTKTSKNFNNIESVKRSPVEFNPFLVNNATNEFSSPRSPDNNKPSPRFESDYKHKEEHYSESMFLHTPQKKTVFKSPTVHKVNPGSLGNSAIKIVHTPSKRIEEKNKELEEEFVRNLKKIESEKKSTERSIGVLRETVEFLKGNSLGFNSNSNKKLFPS